MLTRKSCATDNPHLDTVFSLEEFPTTTKQDSVQVRRVEAAASQVYPMLSMNLDYSH